MAVPRVTKTIRKFRPAGYRIAHYTPSGVLCYAKQVGGVGRYVNATFGGQVWATPGTWIVRDGMEPRDSGLSVWTDDDFQREFALVEDSAEVPA